MDLADPLVRPHRRPLGGVLPARGLRLRRRDAAAVRPSRRRGAEHRAADDRAGLGRERGLAGRRGRSDVRGVPGLVRDDVLRVLPRPAAHPLLPDRPRRLVRMARRRARRPGGGRPGPGRTRSAASAPRCSGESASRASSTGSRSTPTATSRATPRSLQPVHGLRGDRSRGAVRVPRGDLPHAAHAGRPPPALGGRGAHGSRSRLRSWRRSTSSGRSPSRWTATRRTCSHPCVPAALGIAALVLAVVFVFTGRNGRAFAMTGGAAIALVATLFTSLYPRVMVSSTGLREQPHGGRRRPRRTTRSQVMSVVALIFVPLVLLYQGWTYYVFRQRVGGGDAEQSGRASRRRCACLDPRLLRRARAARRRCSGSTRCSASAVALLVLAQACSSRASPPAPSTARRSAAWRGRSSCSPSSSARARSRPGASRSRGGGRRATCSRRFGSTSSSAAAERPAALDGAESAEVATAAVAGVDALETTFARYLPQVVLAVVVRSRCSSSSRRSTWSRPA